MATRPRARKRVFALRRAPDGSAFQKCSICGLSVAIALADIHECEHKMEAKRFKGTCGIRGLPKPEPRLHDQPVSPFRLFMDKFAKDHAKENLFEVERMGFEKWQNMTDKEKYPYVFQARVVDNFHQDTLNKEAEEIIKVDDEAESARVEKKVDKVDKNKGKAICIDSSADSKTQEKPADDESC